MCAAGLCSALRGRGLHRPHGGAGAFAEAGGARGRERRDCGPGPLAAQAGCSRALGRGLCPNSLRSLESSSALRAPRGSRVRCRPAHFPVPWPPALRRVRVIYPLVQTKEQLAIRQEKNGIETDFQQQMLWGIAESF